MKKILLTAIAGFCFTGFAMAQAPAKVAAKKSVPLLTTTSTSQAESKAEMEARIKAKQKDYEAMKASSTPEPVNKVASNDPQGARPKRSN